MKEPVKATKPPRYDRAMPRRHPYAVDPSVAGVHSRPAEPWRTWTPLRTQLLSIATVLHLITCHGWSRRTIYIILSCTELTKQILMLPTAVPDRAEGRCSTHS